MASRELWMRWTGEFVVIVIGVLAALAVDDLRDARGTAGERAYLLERLVEDLGADSVDLAGVMSVARNRVLAAETLLEHFGDPAAGQIEGMGRGLDLWLDTIRANVVAEVTLARAVSDLGNYRLLNLSSSAFDEAEAVGVLDVIDDFEIRERVVGYYSRARGLLQTDEWMLEAHRGYTMSLRSVGVTPSDAAFMPDLEGRLPRDPRFLAEVRGVREQALLQFRYHSEQSQMGTELSTAIRARLQS